MISINRKNSVGFIVIIIPFVTFLLGLTVGYNQAKYDLKESFSDISVPSTIGEKNITNNNSGLLTGEEKQSISKIRKEVDLTLFWKVWEILGNTYIDSTKIQNDQMIYGAIKGMVASMKDPYTLFMDPKETEEFRNSLSGDLQGIGAELSIKEGHLVVVSPLKNSPAEKAGLKPGDIVYKIDGVLSSTFSLTEAVLKIRGHKGTRVILSVIREGEDKPLDLAIERNEIKVPSVSHEMKDNNIAYISINQFGDDTTKEFNQAVNDILLKKPTAIILDLRYNGGGYLNGAVDIVSEFIEEGIVTTVRKKEMGQRDEIVDVQKVSGHAKLDKLPLVVLVNEGSASASEIVAGAIKDHKRGILIGEKTFGKGTVQELQPLYDGSSLRITIAKWFTPNNQNIHGIGIMPDIEVKISPEDAKNNKDTQLEKAIGYLTEQLNK